MPIDRRRQPALLEDRRLAIVATARERVARLGVAMARPPPSPHKKRKLGTLADEAGSLVVRTSDCRIVALDADARYDAFGALLRKRPRRIDDHRASESRCVVCLEDDAALSVGLVDDRRHACDVARACALCVECARRLLSQRSPVACPLCRHAIAIEDIVVVERWRPPRKVCT